MDPEENRSTRNLLPLCIEHSFEVDDKALESRYPAHLLREWKQQQLAECQRMQRSWPLSDREAEDVARISFDPAPAGDQAVLAIARGVARLIAVARRERDRPRMEMEAWRRTYESVRRAIVAWNSEGERIYAEPSRVDTDRHRTAVIRALQEVLAVLSPLADAVHAELAAIGAASKALSPWCDWVDQARDEVLTAAGVWRQPPPFEDDGRFDAALVELQHATDSLTAKWRGEAADDPPPVLEQPAPNTPAQDTVAQRLRQHQELLERARPYARVGHRPYDSELAGLLCSATAYAASIPRIPSTLSYDLHATAALAAAVARNADPAELRSLIMDCSQRHPLAAAVLLLRELMFTAQRTGQENLEQEAASLGTSLLFSADWSEHLCWEGNKFHAAILLDLEASVNGPEFTRARLDAALCNDPSLLSHVLRGCAEYIEHRNSRSSEPMGWSRRYSTLPAWFPQPVIVAQIKAQFPHVTASEDWESQRRYDDEVEQLAAQVLFLTSG